MMLDKGLVIRFLLLLVAICLAEANDETDFDCIEVGCRCMYGIYWTTDGNGCTYCSCLPRGCTESCEELTCPSGRRVVLPSGCPTCDCQPAECPVHDCLPDVSCPGGFAKDENGCETCQCKPVCPLVKCQPCRNGYYLNDSRGCQTCRCKQCPKRRCPRCPNGYLVDKKGCQTCACKP